MPKINTGEQADLFPEIPSSNQVAKQPNKKEKKEIITPLEMTLLMLKMEYRLKSQPKLFNTRLEEIREKQRSERRTNELEKRLLKLLEGDEKKFTEHIKQIEAALETEKNKPLPDPYATYEHKVIKTPKNMTKEEKKGAPFCDKCQHYHWPEEPHSDWRE